MKKEFTELGVRRYKRQVPWYKMMYGEREIGEDMICRRVVEVESEAWTAKVVKVRVDGKVDRSAPAEIKMAQGEDSRQREVMARRRRRGRSEQWTAEVVRVSAKYIGYGRAREVGAPPTGGH
jgi:hypothetical protein